MTTNNPAQPAWLQPSNQSESDLPKLHIYNSLTRSKTPFVPLNHQQVTWYACGPTVYDDAHLGHARTYVTSDIIRRILRDYFGYKVRFVMNITDIDDKIILRARQQFLLKTYKNQFRRNDGSLRASLSYYVKKHLKMVVADDDPAVIHKKLSSTYADLQQRKARDDTEEKTKMHIKAALAAAQDVISIETKPPGTEMAGLPASLDDVLMAWLDSEQGRNVNAKDHSVFTKLTKRHENRFTADMQALNVLDPDDITRVTEYVPQIVEFVEKIQANTFAYQTSKGVYFDVNAFEGADYHYARLEPGNRNDTALQADGEGAITGSESKGDPEKRSQADFALWKLSKPGEPSWPSPWGDGRPGWHIECSAMASDKLGKQIDIHSGGVDLAFPHHDNELAQSEAYWADRTLGHDHQWVNYFIHMGHLSIDGLKMSKSLKNFTTIREALESGTWTSRGLRILLLLGSWKEGIEITNALIQESTNWEEKMNNFFIRARSSLESAEAQFGSLQLDGDRSSSQAFWKTDEASMAPQSANANEDSSGSLEKAFVGIKHRTFKALSDSADTRKVMIAISELVTRYNAASPEPPVAFTQRIAEWLTSMVNMFGLNGTATRKDLSIGWSGIDIPENARTALTAISTVRDILRTKALARTISHADIIDTVTASRRHFPIHDIDQPFVEVLQEFWAALESIPTDSALSQRVLHILDQIRNEQLFNRGISLEDREGDKPALIRLVTKEQREERQAKERKAQEKAEAKAQRETDERVRLEKAKLSPSEMFKTTKDQEQFSEWDDKGVPTKDKAGEPLAKTKRKRLEKDWEKQKKSHEAWKKSNEQ